jgi:hypothetical protein
MAVLTVDGRHWGCCPGLCLPSLRTKTSGPARKFVEGEIRLPASVLRQLAGTIRARTGIVAEAEAEAEAVAENPAETRATDVNRTS